MKAQNVPDTRGLDPAIHHTKKMDARVKPAHGGLRVHAPRR